MWLALLNNCDGRLNFFPLQCRGAHSAANWLFLFRRHIFDEKCVNSNCLISHLSFWNAQKNRVHQKFQ